MNYLLDKKQKRKKVYRAFIIAIALFLVLYFRETLYRGFSYVTSVAFQPILSFGNNTKERFANLDYYLSSKENLMKENEKLKLEMELAKTSLSNQELILEENNKLKEILGRTDGKKNLVLGTILSKPKQSIYGSIIIDVGIEENIEVGDIAFAFGDIPIGKISEVYPSTSKVILFSTAKEELEVSIDNKYFIMKGRGGGNFEIEAPRDSSIEKGKEAIIPSITPRVVAKVETIISDPRESFKKVILVSPVNLLEVKFLQIQIR